MRLDRASYGKYKSAYRNYSVDTTPAADREATERSLDVSQELFVSAVAADRASDHTPCASSFTSGMPNRSASAATA